jgi:hypothetical protein
MSDHFEVVLYVDGHSPAAAAARRCFERVGARFDGVSFDVCDVSADVERAARDRVVFTPAVVARRNGRVCVTVIGTVYDEPLARALENAGLPLGQASLPDGWERRRRRELDDLHGRVVELERRLKERAQREAAMTLMLEQADLDTASAHLYQAQQATDEASARRAIDAALRVLKRWN